MASIALKRDHAGAALVLWLLVTFVLGAASCCMEAHDFVTMASHGATPDRSGFLSGFFVLVGMHGLHVTVGLILDPGHAAADRACFGRDEKVKINLIRLSLFWHFLDVVWIAIVRRQHL